jgi:hypothetical protein
MKTQAEVVRDLLSEITKAPYVVGVPRPYDASKKPAWYVTCLDGYYYEKTVHADTVWADQNGIWIESGHLGSPTSWAEETYGEKEAGQLMDMNINYHGLTVTQIMSLLKDFPKLYERIDRCVGIAKMVSQESGIPIELVFDAKEDAGWFIFRARVSFGEGRTFEEDIRKAVNSMKEVHDRAEMERS